MKLQTEVDKKSRKLLKQSSKHLNVVQQLPKALWLLNGNKKNGC